MFHWLVRELICSGQCLVHGLGAVPAVGHGLDHQGLAGAAVAAGVYLGRLGGIAVGDHVTAGVGVHSECLSHVAAGAQEAGGHHQQLAGQGLFRLRDLLHGQAALAVIGRLQVHGDHRLKPAVLIGLEGLDRGLVDVGVLAEHGQAFLLAAVHLHVGPVLAAGLVNDGLARILGQHLQLDHGAAPSPEADPRQSFPVSPPPTMTTSFPLGSRAAGRGASASSRARVEADR